MDSVAEDDITLPLDFDRRYFNNELFYLLSLCLRSCCFMSCLDQRVVSLRVIKTSY